MYTAGRASPAGTVGIAIEEPSEPRSCVFRSQGGVCAPDIPLGSWRIWPEVNENINTRRTSDRSTSVLKLCMQAETGLLVIVESLFQQQAE